MVEDFNCNTDISIDPYVDANDLEQYIQAKLYAFNGAKELAWAWNSKENVILFGAGGYGKSDAAILFHQYLKAKGLVETANPFVMAFGQGMTEERLLGGLDIKKFQAEGEIIYLLQNAFVNSEVVIFEELWDAFPAVLLVLKDILQSKCVRMGNINYPIKTKLVIACTNRSREEVVSDASTEALMQRFLFEKEVVWSSWTTSDYLNAFSCATGKVNGEIETNVAELCAAASKGEHKISPRTAGKALKSAKVNGIESLNGMFGFNSVITEYLTTQSSKKMDREQAVQINATLAQIETLHSKVATMNSGIKAIETTKLMFSLAANINLGVRDANKPIAERAVETANKAIDLAFQYAKSIIINPKEGSFAAKVKAANSFSEIADIVK